jgi:vacuolar-type H+-ATPase subunit I/STV1
MGLDPVWGLSKQRLNFSNNVKMKLSVIYGVIHMSMGIVMKGTNTLMRKDYLGFTFEVVGGLIILLFLFGWMDLLIYGKWFFSWAQFDDRTVIQPIVINANKTETILDPVFKGDWANRLAPSVINVLINTVFGGGAPPDAGLVQFAYLYPQIVGEPESARTH